MLVSIFHTAWTTVFWGHGYWGHGSIPRAIVFDVVIVVVLVVLVSRRMRRLRRRGTGPGDGASAERGMGSEVAGLAASLNPLHHDPLPPFPDPPDDDAK